jgi:hypothetical protein
MVVVVVVVVGVAAAAAAVVVVVVAVVVVVVVVVAAAVVVVVVVVSATRTKQLPLTERNARVYALRNAQRPQTTRAPLAIPTHQRVLNAAAKAASSSCGC